MNHIVREYEEEFSNTCAEITVLCGQLKHASSADVAAGLETKLETMLHDAEETLEQVEVEAPNLDQPAREKVRGRIVSYRKELDRLKGVFRSCKQDADERNARMELFNHNSDFGDKETDLLLDDSEILESSGRQLDAGRRLLKETEDIGAGVLSDLSNQRETLERSRNRLRDVEAGLGESSAVLSKMLFRARQNKLVLYLVAAVVLIGVLAVIYSLVT